MIAMLDKISRDFLEELRKRPDQKIGTIIPPNPLPKGCENKAAFLAMIENLLREGKLDPVLDHEGKRVGVSLSHAARHPHRYNWHSFWAYIKANWIAILALAVSIIALVRTL